MLQYTYILVLARLLGNFRVDAVIIVIKLGYIISRRHRLVGRIIITITMIFLTFVEVGVFFSVPKSFYRDSPWSPQYVCSFPERFKRTVTTTSTSLTINHILRTQCPDAIYAVTLTTSSCSSYRACCQMTLRSQPPPLDGVSGRQHGRIT